MTSSAHGRALVLTSAAALAVVMIWAHWYGLFAYFQQDDFVWLGLDPHNFRELRIVLFLPTPHGTLRPLGDRGFFIVLRHLAGIHAGPFRTVVFLTEWVNLLVLASVVSHLSASRLAGFLAAVIWVVHPALVLPMVWTAGWYQVLGACAFLAAFRLWIAYAETGRRRALLAQWLVFLAGFGAIESMIVYPFIPIAHALACRRRVLWPAVLLLIPSGAYLAVHLLLIPHPAGQMYALHLDGSIIATFGRYLRLLGREDAGGTSSMWTVVLAAVGVALLVWSAIRRRTSAIVYVAWFVLTLAPVLPIADHVERYYLVIPLIGLAALTADVLVDATRVVPVPRWAATAACGALVGLYLLAAVPVTRRTSEWWYERSQRVKRLMDAVARTHEQFPQQAILVDHVDPDLYWNSLEYEPGRLIGVIDVYVPAEGDFRLSGVVPRRINALARTVADQRLRDGTLRVLDVRASSVVDVTASRALAAAPFDRPVPTLR